MATYYVDSRTGSDANNGASASSAFSSLAKVNSLNLLPGDTVLFARGATFNGGIEVRTSGTSGAPVTFGAYGSGADPTLSGGQNGVDGNGKSHIVVRDLHITNKTGAGIVSFGSTDWTIDNVDVDNVGKEFVPGNNEFSAFQFRGVNTLTIQNSSYHTVNGDGVFLWDAANVKILSNNFQVPQGASADNLHTYRMTNYEIRGNVMSFVGATNSGKGIMVVQESKNGVIADNTFLLGQSHYAIGGTIQDGVIERNHFVGRADGTWSTGLNITETLGTPSTVNNMAIRNNFFDGTGMGIYTWDGNNAGTAYRNNFQVTGNIFKDLRDAPLVSEAPVKLNGTYANNTYINTGDPNIGGTAGAWSTSNNVHTSQMPAWTGGAGSYTPVAPIEGIIGTDGNDTLVGTDGADTIWGDKTQGTVGGNDTLRGGKGDDYLSGGAGNDTYVGERGGGMDTIRWFETGKDKIDVKLFGWKSLAEMQAAGVTMTSGTNSSGAFVTVNFGGGDGFKVFGVSSLAATDFSFASAGTSPAPIPTPTPTPGETTGTEGNDTLAGTDGADTILGLGGNDRLRGGKGNDSLSGGAGTDTYVGERSGGMDTIRWFEAGEKIDVSLFGWKSFTEMQAAGVTLTSGVDASYLPFVTVNFGGGDGFKVFGVSSLAAADFSFASTPPSPDVIGTTGADILTGTAVAQTVDGKAGNDTLTGGGGHDTFVVRAGDGSDTITDFMGSNPRPWLIAAESDTIKFSGAGMTAANMRILQSGENVVITFDGVENSQITLAKVWTSILDNQAGAAHGFVFDGQTAVTDSFDTMIPGAAMSQVAKANHVTFLTDDANTVSGLDNSADVINGQGGNDTLSGKSGNDVLRGDAGNDRLDGGLGDDVLVGGAGSDTLIGGGGSDTAVYAGLFADYSITTSGATSTIKDLKPAVAGDDGADTLTGVTKLQFADRVVALDSSSGGATINGTSGGDVLTGKDGVNDVINGAGGDDTLHGLSGDDTLRGDAGNDQLFGGAGNDRLFGGAEIDILNGGEGADTFVLSRGMNVDIVSGFEAGADKLDLSAFGLSSMAVLTSKVQSTGPATMFVDFGGGDQLHLFGIGKLTADNIIL